MDVPAENRIYLDLCSQIAEFRSAFVSQHQDEITVRHEEIGRREKEGQPLLYAAKVVIEEEFARQFVDDLLPLVKRNESFDDNSNKLLNVWIL